MFLCSDRVFVIRVRTVSCPSRATSFPFPFRTYTQTLRFRGGNSDYARRVRTKRGGDNANNHVRVIDNTIIIDTRVRL